MIAYTAAAANLKMVQYYAHQTQLTRNTISFSERTWSLLQNAAGTYSSRPNASAKCVLSNPSHSHMCSSFITYEYGARDIGMNKSQHRGIYIHILFDQK